MSPKTSKNISIVWCVISWLTIVAGYCIDNSAMFSIGITLWIFNLADAVNSRYRAELTISELKSSNECLIRTIKSYEKLYSNTLDEIKNKED